MTCSNCVHVDVCENRFSWLDQEDNSKHIVCHHFKNKADVVEVRHGEWIWDTEDKYKCSHCHYTTRVDEVMGLPQYKYCPNCCAKMDGERRDT